MTDPNETESLWTFRPTALLGTLTPYAAATRLGLMNSYLRDNKRAASAAAASSTRSGPMLPPKPPNCMRVCQWNVHYLVAPWHSGSEYDDGSGGGGPAHADSVARAILDTDADVAVISEFGMAGRDPGATERMCRRLELADYSVYDLAGGGYPTAVMTRLPVLKSAGHGLDAWRGAVQVTVGVGGDGSADACTPVTIFGTHLDDSSSEYRRTEANNLLDIVKSSTTERDPVLIVGDFNQQRAVDYSPDEWEAIRANMERRGAPADDGVFALLQGAGFDCCYDQREAANNWREGDPPPATHWSSTVIDYSYGRNMILSGIFVLPHSHSDHRMVVSDWKVDVKEEPRKKKHTFGDR